ncbi:hypothetical protein QZH41_011631, partial [Actinostola sp. cb2023]
MLPNYSPVTQALLGTLFTWAVTAAGSALVFLFNSGQRKVLDGSLGFAAGSIDLSVLFSLLQGLECPNIADAVASDSRNSYTQNDFKKNSQETVIVNNTRRNETKSSATKRTISSKHFNENIEEQAISNDMNKEHKLASWKRIMLLIVAITVHNIPGMYDVKNAPLIVAITVHNIPEGLAVGVAFGAIGKSESATFENARNLAIGIGIQNFPEGLAVSLPLHASGVSLWRSFWYGQLSGMVEPIAGLLGAYAVVVAEPLLPYALSFAAGAMVYVVVDDIIPEAQT